MNYFSVICCKTCKGAGRDDDNASCQNCIGRGWVWSDGQPATTCPMIEAHRPRLACSRKKIICPNCLRPSNSIPTVIDIYNERKAVGLTG